jgi:hypothetical protein
MTWSSTSVSGRQRCRSGKTARCRRSRSTSVRCRCEKGLHGVKPLTDKDRGEIRKNIDEKILRGLDITFRATAVEGTGGRLMVQGELTLEGKSRPVSFELEMTADEHVTGTVPVT